MPTSERAAAEKGMDPEDYRATSFGGRTPEGVVRFRVYGDPKSQGSMRAFMPKGGKRPVMIHDGGAAFKAWRQDVAERAAKIADGAEPIAEAVEVFLHFYLRRPVNSTPKKRPWPIVAPDIDKLARLTLDAMVAGGLLADDKYVVSLNVTKNYADRRPPGLDVRLRVVG